MTLNNVFLVSFAEDGITILHDKCGSEAIQTPLSGDKQDGFCFSCPLCNFETMYFLKAPWDQILEKLKKSPEKTKMIIQKCYKVDKIVLSTSEAIVLEKRTLVG